MEHYFRLSPRHCCITNYFQNQKCQLFTNFLLISTTKLLLLMKKTPGQSVSICSLGVCRSQYKEIFFKMASYYGLPWWLRCWVWSQGQEEPLEKGMAMHSSILTYRTHGQRNLVGYSPWGHRVRHDWG